MRTVYDNFPYHLYEDYSDEIIKIIPIFEGIAWDIHEKKRSPKVTFGIQGTKCDIVLSNSGFLTLLFGRGAIYVEDLDYNLHKNRRDFFIKAQKRFDKGEILVGTIDMSDLWDFKEAMNAVIDLKDNDPFSFEKQAKVLAGAILAKRDFLERDEFGIDETILGENAEHIDFIDALRTLAEKELIEFSIKSIELDTPVDKQTGVAPHCKGAVIVYPKLRKFMEGQRQETTLKDLLKEEKPDKTTFKQFLKRFLELKLLPKKQVKLIKILSDFKLVESAALRKLVGTKNLKSLLRDTRARIKHYGLDDVLIIRNVRSLGSFPKSYYQLEIQQLNLSEQNTGNQNSASKTHSKLP